MSFGKKITLSSGHEIPLIGYGTWQAAPGEVGQGVLEALKAGYRHLDLALIYQNQREVAQGLKKAFAEISGLKREDIFITSKLWNHQHAPQDVEAALDGCLAELELDYLDLYLIHWPVAFPGGNTYFPKAAGNDTEVAIDDAISLAATWKAMTQLPKSKVRTVGVSNFSTAHLDAVIAATSVVPAVNQIERHPRLPNPTLINYCKDKNIHITAYSAFGNNSQNIPLLVAAPEIKAVAERLSKAKGKDVTPAQVILAWSCIGGHSVIPKSVTPSRIRENFQEVELDKEDVESVNDLGNTPKRFNIPIDYSPKWNIDIFGDESEQSAKHQVILGA